MNLRLPVGLAALVAATSCIPHEAERPSVARADPTVVEAKAFVDRLAFGAPSTAPIPGITPPHGGDAPVEPASITAAPSFVAASRSADDAARAADCLTTAVYYEARSEPRDGQRAVAQVVLNRVRDRAFPASICGVVFQGSERRTGCQFSFTCDGSMLRGRRDEAAWQRAREVAEAALAGDVYAPIGSATFFHTTAISPWWAPSLSRIGTVGAHIFYRWQNAIERSLSFRQSYGGYEPVATPRATDLIADAGEPPAATTLDAAGWRVADVAGVTVHRTDPAADIQAAATAAVAPAESAETKPTGRTIRAEVAGVRIHRNIEVMVADES
ncbi:hypothetical protein GGQ80_001605 [Sphingomonas jinjuensis]|uniref:Cell wall hydrolase SleB domain-containing protein n=1 Tax=Sphingomonas jinjuensis TaxID=535907 RepID=A0A840F7J9_9SPHN|nr:cell wall hydrolase [Sphingomonas jinjuensis]MBB4153699.1 hypothetical protein [Sphingomonas jinjuensis]